MLPAEFMFINVPEQKICRPKLSNFSSKNRAFALKKKEAATLATTSLILKLTINN